MVQNRANYARIKTVLQALGKRKDVKVSTVVSSSMILEKFGRPVDVMEADGFAPDGRIHSSLEGDEPVTMAKSTGILLSEMATHFFNLRPNLVVCVADRFETLAAATAASYMNIAVAHTQGGEVSGSIDERVRHAVTKLSDLHFPATARAAEFLNRMGERPDSIFNFGCPAMDLVLRSEGQLDLNGLNRLGVGGQIEPNRPIATVVFHPVTTALDTLSDDVAELISAVEALLNRLQIIWLWPNIDSGSDTISRSLRQLLEQNRDRPLRFIKNLSPEDYIKLLRTSDLLIGNSSSGIREGSFLGLPVVNIGNRQNLRERGLNVLDAEMKNSSIVTAAETQLEQSFEPSSLFGQGDAGVKIANVLATFQFGGQKILSYT